MKHLGCIVAGAFCGLVCSVPARAGTDRAAAPQAAAPSAAEAPAALLSEGLDALRRSDYATAERTLQSVPARGGDRPAALLALGQAEIEQGRFARALEDARQAGADPRSRTAAAALGALVLSAQGKVAQAIHQLGPFKDAGGTPGRRVRLELAALLIRTGRRAEAEPLLLRFADEYSSDAITASDAEGLAMAGRAMALLRHPRDANRAYNESERAARGRVETLKWRAELYLDHDDPGHAEEVLTEGLKIAPRRADLMVSLARVKLKEALDFDAADKLAQRALSMDPKLTSAYAVQAAVALHDGRIGVADSAIEQGLAIDPVDLELLSLRAAGRLLADDTAGFQVAMRRVLAQDQQYSDAYTIVGEYAEWVHRYDEVVRLMKQAVAIDPHDARAWAELGLVQTRDGDEAGGQASLARAWSEDHFNVRVYNTLEMLYGRWIPQEYQSVKDGIFEIRYPKDEKAILERYVPRMLRRAWASMKLRYDFAPAVPVAIELYADRQHFSVRTSGLPDIGIQGACFGRMVAAMSPSSEPFNWGNVLWHELGHVFAIQLSASRVPRWFTEGLSEYETAIARPEWRRELDPELYLALKDRLLPGALEMDTAFTHPEGGLDVTVAYYAASRMVQFTAERFGFPAIRRALALWGRREKTPQVIREAFGVEPARYDAEFREWAMRQLSRYAGQYLFLAPAVALDQARADALARPRDPKALTALAVALLRAHRPEDAAGAIRAALRIDGADKDANFVAAEIAAISGDADEQRARLLAIRSAGGDGYAVEAALAKNARARGDSMGERSSLDAAYAFDPTQSQPLRRLYALDAAQHRDADTVDVLRRLVALNQHDRLAWRLLLEALVRSGRWDEARRIGQGALYVDVESAPVHIAYAEALAATGDHAEALFELQSALLCSPSPEQQAQARTLLAREQGAMRASAPAPSH